MVLFCVVFLASGFIYAAKQHFEAMDYSIKNEKLLKQIEELENEQRRLKLQKEEALSPAEIKKTARKLGFREISAENIEIMKKQTSEEDSETRKAEEQKKEDTKGRSTVLMAEGMENRSVIRNKDGSLKNISQKESKNP